MYVWKCWLDYRRFVFSFALGMAFLICAMDNAVLRPGAFRTSGGAVIAATSMEVKNQLVEVCKGLLILTGSIGGLLMGCAGGIAVEYDGKTAELLFTRPLRRRRFMWTNFFAGMIAVELSVVIPLVISVAFCLLRAHVLLPPRVWVFAVVTIPMNFILFGITFLAGVAMRGASKGAVAGVAVYGVYLTTYAVLHSYFGFETPWWWFDQQLHIGMVSALTRAEVQLLVLWLVLPLVLPYAAQRVLEARDVA